MSKVTKSSAPAFAKGGGGKMFGKQFAGPQKSGTTATATKTGKGGPPKGGSTKMFGKQSASPRVPGKTGK